MIAVTRAFPRALAAGIALSALAAGCGGQADAPGSLTVYPVEGKVVFEDGKPLTRGRVVLVSTTAAVAPSGEVKPDGSFTINSGDAGEGAPAGEYKVRIEPDFSAGGKGKPQSGAKPPFPSRYFDEDASGLKVTVKAEPNRLEPFKLSLKPDRVASARDRD